MRGLHASILIAAGLAFATPLGAWAESPEPPQRGGDCNDCAAGRGPRIVVDQPPVQVVFQQAAPTACCEHVGCLKRLFCGSHAPCCYMTVAAPPVSVAPAYSYASPTTYALAAPAVQSYALVAPAAQSFAFAAPAAQSFTLAAPAAQSFAFAAPAAQSIGLTAAPSFNVSAAQGLSINPLANALAQKVYQDAEQQALSAYAESLRAGLAQAESAQTNRVKAESVRTPSDSDCCQQIDALIKQVKEMQTTVIAHQRVLLDHESRIKTLEGRKN